MLRSLLLFTLLCTCGPAQMLAQFTIAIDAGYSSGTFNRQPQLLGFPRLTNERHFLKAINSMATGAEISYAPATSSFSWGLKVNYSRRGYEHRFESETSPGFGRGILFPSYVDYLDFIPRLTYRPGRLLSASIGPYGSFGRKKEDNPFVVERERVTYTHDYGVHAEGRIYLDRFYTYVAYQRSFRPYNFEGISSFMINNQPISVDQPSPISSIQIGIGFTIIR